MAAKKVAVNAKKRNRFAGKGKNKRKKSNLATGRNYTKDKKYQKKKVQVKNRVTRNSARAGMMKAGKVKKGDRKDVDHKRPLKKGGGNGRKNLRVTSQKKNRSRK